MEDFKSYRNFDPSFLTTGLEDFSGWGSTPKFWTHPNLHNQAVYKAVDFERQLDWFNEIQPNICYGKDMISVIF